MHSLRPSPALVIALLALLLAAGGGAYAASRSTGSAVNIVDPVTAANKVKVSSGGSLQVSGSVNSTPTSSTNDLHGITGVDPTTSCQTVLTPPSGKALIVTQVHVDTYYDPAPGAGQFVLLDSGTCSSLTAALDIANPGGVGVTDLSFDPGLGIPAGSALSIVSGGSVEADVSAFGYSTSASNVPAVTESTAGVPPQR